MCGWSNNERQSLLNVGEKYSFSISNIATLQATMLTSENQHHSSKQEDINNFCNLLFDDERRLAKMIEINDG